MNKEEILIEFEREFGPLKHLFEIYSFKTAYLNFVKPMPAIDWARPGVYIYLFKESVIKVGKSQVNSFKRSLEHIRDNTSTKDGSIKMADFKEEKDVEIVLLNLKEDRNIHWVLAVEYYLEHRLNPAIRSGRSG